VEHGIELALGGISPPAHILDHNGAAGFHSAQDLEIAAYFGVFLVIRRAGELTSVQQRRTLFLVVVGRLPARETILSPLR
jgi:hypothetical protein